MSTEKQREKLTLGYRCRINENADNAHYNGHECLLVERSRGSFSVMVLRKGYNIQLERTSGVVIDEYAWVNEKDLELVDKDVNENVGFIDWYQSVKEYECPDCLHLCWDDKKQEATLKNVDEDECCPECGCEFL